MKKKVAGVRKEQSVVGRPREFDTDAALEKAMRLFWAKGYEGTSVADLTETLGISRPSLVGWPGVVVRELFAKQSATLSRSRVRIPPPPHWRVGRVDYGAVLERRLG